MEASGQVRAGWRSLQAEESSGKRVKVKTTKTLGAGVSDASWNRKGPGGGAEEQQGWFRAVTDQTPGACTALKSM